MNKHNKKVRRHDIMKIYGSEIKKEWNADGARGAWLRNNTNNYVKTNDDSVIGDNLYSSGETGYAIE